MTPSPAFRHAPLRVMQITEDLGVGGLERVVVSIAKRIDLARFSPYVLCLRETGPLAEELSAAGVPVYCLGYGAGRPDYTAFLGVRRLLRDLRIDVVHSHNTNALIAGSLGALLAGGRTIVHTDHARAHPDKLRYYVAEHLASYGVSRMVGVSDATTRELREREWIPQRKLVTIPNGVDELPFGRDVDFAAMRASLNIPAAAPVVGMIARLTRQKGGTHLLGAMPDVLRAFPSLVLVVAGDGDERPALEEQARSLGVHGNIRFLGTRLDAPDLMRLFDVFVIPSEWEGLPLSLLEAMAAGTPVVASAVGGIGSVVRDSESAVLLPPGDSERLGAAIVRLLASPDLRRQLSSNARQIFDERFSVSRMVRAYEGLYLREDAG